ncbi:hypothetical protein BGZ95_009131 [Linnemannia exigua]|uniref:Uncharacterized protein n=1 Tax=Linnemannia exigua TaxID=604196 RepID=A0AAD4DDW4_9FUNG|nr:hypothetical protein BGZ95_009131 [Linnemannia exigua]
MANNKHITSPSISFGSDPGQEESSSAPVRAINTGSKKHLTLNHYDFMLDWLERDDNYKRIFGPSGKPVIGKDTEGSRKAFKDWAYHTNLAGDPQLTAYSLKTRFGRYLAKYKTIKSNERPTGFVLTEEDYRDEVTTIARRYEKDCPRFARMDRIFGKKLIIHTQACMEGSVNRRLEVYGADIVVEQLKDHDEETVLEGEDNDYQDEREDAPPQDELVDQEDSPLDEGAQELLAVVRHGKRVSVARVVAPARGKRARTEEPHKSPSKLNIGLSQLKDSAFASAYLDGVKARAQSIVDIETAKLAWDREKWEKETALRNKELEANLETQRLSVIANLLKQGIVDKDLFAQVLNRTERSREHVNGVDGVD